MISYLGSLVQFSPATGRAGRCRQTSLCVGSTRRVPATRGLPRTGVSVLSPSALLRLPAALYGAGPALSAVPGFGSSTDSVAPAFLCLPPASAVQAARGLGALSLGAVRLFPPWPQHALPVACVCSEELARSWALARPSQQRMSTIQNLRNSLDRNRGLFAVREGVASLELSLPLPPPSASFLQRGWAGSSLEFLSPFVLRTAGSVSRPVNFSLLSHSLKELPPTALRAFGRSLP